MGKDREEKKKSGELREREVTAAPPGLGPFKCFTDSAKLPPQVAFFMNEKRPYIHYINNSMLIGQWPPVHKLCKTDPGVGRRDIHLLANGSRS